MSEYKFKINGNQYDVQVVEIKDGKAQVKVNGTGYEVEYDAPAKVAAAPAAAAVAAASSPAAAAPAKGKTVKSPLPGVVLQVFVKEGQNVKRGEKIAVLEAMKMENEILSPADGVVESVNVNQGDSVLEGAVIAKIA